MSRWTGAVDEQPYELAARYGAGFLVVECLCSDIDIHQFRIEGRDGDIPGWYELDWEQVQWIGEVPLAYELTMTAL